MESCAFNSWNSTVQSFFSRFLLRSTLRSQYSLTYAWPQSKRIKLADFIKAHWGWKMESVAKMYGFFATPVSQPSAAPSPPTATGTPTSDAKPKTPAAAKDSPQKKHKQPQARPDRPSQKRKKQKKR